MQRVNLPVWKLAESGSITAVSDSAISILRGIFSVTSSIPCEIGRSSNVTAVE
ncbi:hypothetical protein [Nostoc sp.]|uniref:hypothetical protein n=1 Tax=Nostoc sp. TaxID=1180 RepID=UPI002FFCF4CA